MGNEIFIEVKSTVSKDKDYFEISDIEVLAAKSLKDSYFIYQVTDALANPKISAIIRKAFHLKLINFCILLYFAMEPGSQIIVTCI